MYINLNRKFFFDFNTRASTSLDDFNHRDLIILNDKFEVDYVGFCKVPRADSELKMHLFLAKGENIKYKSGEYIESHLYTSLHESPLLTKENLLGIRVITFPSEKSTSTAVGMGNLIIQRIDIG